MQGILLPPAPVCAAQILPPANELLAAAAVVSDPKVINEPDDSTGQAKARRPVPPTEVVPAVIDGNKKKPRGKTCLKCNRRYDEEGDRHGDLYKKWRYCPYTMDVDRAAFEASVDAKIASKQK